MVTMFGVFFILVFQIGTHEATWVISDYIASPNSNELSVSKGQQVEIVEAPTANEPDFCLVRLNPQSDDAAVQEGVVPVSILKPPPGSQKTSSSRKDKNDAIQEQSEYFFFLLLDFLGCHSVVAWSPKTLNWLDVFYISYDILYIFICIALFLCFNFYNFSFSFFFIFSKQSQQDRCLDILHQKKRPRRVSFFQFLLFFVVFCNAKSVNCKQNCLGFMKIKKKCPQWLCWWQHPFVAYVMLQHVFNYFHPWITL